MCAWKWKEGGNTGKDDLALLEVVVWVPRVKLRTGVTICMPFYERWDNSELTKVLHPFLDKRKA